MFEFKRVEITTRTLVRKGVTELNILGRDGWQIKAAFRDLTGHGEVIYLERQLEEQV